jgi:hypothetical protein
LARGDSVLIDRTNIDADQRWTWVALARRHGAQVGPWRPGHWHRGQGGGVAGRRCARLAVASAARELPAAHKGSGPVRGGC